MFKKKWSSWKDLSIGHFSHCTYLLQARRHQDGRIQFRVAESKSTYYAPSVKLEDLPVNEC